MGGLITKLNLMTNLNLITKETKYVKLLCFKCNSKVKLNYKKDILFNLYCKNCIEEYHYVGEIRHIQIVY